MPFDRIFEIIDNIQKAFNIKAYLYYDRHEKDYSIAITDIELYVNDNFRNFIENFGKELEPFGIYFVCFSEHIIKSSPVFSDFKRFSELKNAELKISVNTEVIKSYSKYTKNDYKIFNYKLGNAA